MDPPDDVTTPTTVAQLCTNDKQTTNSRELGRRILGDFQEHYNHVRDTDDVVTSLSRSKIWKKSSFVFCVDFGDAHYCSHEVVEYVFYAML